MKLWVKFYFVPYQLTPVPEQNTSFKSIKTKLTFLPEMLFCACFSHKRFQFANFCPIVAKFSQPVKLTFHFDVIFVNVY